MKASKWIAALLALSVITSCAPATVLTPLPSDQVAVRYRVEQRDKDSGTWEPVKAGKSFKKNQQIRFRFMSNVAGTLYVLNGSEGANLEPIFDESGQGRSAQKHLGLGTRIEAHRVGLWPRPDQGSAIRFTGYSGKEQFLLVYVPDMGGTRQVLGTAPGAEDWDFEASTTHTALADPGDALFHYFTMKSKQ